MKVALLSGGLLDYWTARSLRLHVQLQQAGQTIYCRLMGPLGGRIYRPCCLHADAKPIIDAERIEIHEEDGRFIARTQLKPITEPDKANKAPCYRMAGATAYEAAMRAFVASVYGFDVPDASPVGETPTILLAGHSF